MASDYNRRASHAQTQFSVDTQTLVNKYEETLQSLEGRYQRELQELAEQQREEKSQWEFERDEIAQEVAEAHKQLKESLASEKAVCCALTQEKDLLEKNFKEEVNKLVCEREQLEKELRELRNAAQEQEEKMKEKISQLQNDHEKELKEKDEHISTVEQNGKLIREKLERLDREYKREKEELNSKLLALESLNRDICERAETEKAEMGLEVSDLRGKIQKLQRETQSFSALQSYYRVLESEYAKAKSQIAAFPGAAPLGDDGDVLQNLQKVHEQAVKENVRMAAQILRLQHRLEAAEQELQLPSPGCSQSGSEPEEMDPSFEGLPSDCHDVAVGADFSVLPPLEAGTTDLEEMSEADWDLEEGCVKAGAGGHPEAQGCWIQGSQAALDADGNQGCDKNLSWVPLLPKKRELEEVPGPKALHNDVIQQKVHLLNHRIAPKNKGFVSGALKMQVELERAEELSEDSLMLDYPPGAANGDLKSVIAQLWKRMEELEDRSTAQAELLSLQEEIQLENEDLKAEVMQLIEKNRVLEDNLRRLRRLCREQEESEVKSVKFEEENAKFLVQVKGLEDVQEQAAQGNADVLSERRGGKLEEHPTAFTGRQDKNPQSDSAAPQAGKAGMREPKPQVEENALAHPEERRAVTQGLQSTCTELQQKVDLLR